MTFLLLFLAVLGHGLFWAGVLNRLHAYRWSRRTIKRFNKLVIGCGVVLPLLMAAWLIARGGLLVDRPVVALCMAGCTGTFLAWAYLILCWVAAAIGLAVWAMRWVQPAAAVERARRTTIRHLSHRDAADHFLMRWPKNQSLQMELVEREIALPRLPHALDGLSIAHLTDLHYTGRVGKSFFAEVADCCQNLAADMIAITGDVLDSHDCLDWLPDTLGRLRAPLGVYWIRGNHEIKVDTARLRAVLDACGLVCLSGRWLQVDVRGAPLVLAGNELPWFPPAADMNGCPPPPDGPLRILLAHSPDQFGWARQNGFDLMLAGHVHGGQIRVPGIGAILSPSRYGVKYACGLFHRPPTVMYVSRGVAGEWPLRYFCRPEITKLILRQPE